MKLLILYHSRSGRTAGLAREIAAGAESVQDCEVLLRTPETITKDDFLASEAVIAGSPVYYGSMSAELKKVLDDSVGIRRKMENKIGAAFTSSNFHTGGKETTMMSILQAMLISGMIVVGDPLSASGHYGVAFSGEMDDSTVSHARLLGARVAELAKATASLRTQE